MRDSFVFYKSFYEAIKNLPDENKLKVFEAIFEYSFNDFEIEIEGIDKAIFTLIKPQLDANNTKYENGKKGGEYGVLGGRPKKQKTPKKPQENPKETPNVNVNVNENVNVNVNDIGVLCEENFEPIKKMDPYSDPLIDDCIEKYKERCSNLCSLTGFERRDSKTREKISEFLTIINRDMAYFERLCDMANQLKFIANHKIDLCSMVNNHIGIINGKFANTEAGPRSENNKNSIAKELALINAKMGVNTT